MFDKPAAAVYEIIFRVGPTHHTFTDLKAVDVVTAFRKLLCHFVKRETAILHVISRTLRFNFIKMFLLLLLHKKQTVNKYS